MAPQMPKVTPLPLFAVDRFSAVPLYYQVAVRLEGLIEDGHVAVGSRLANEIELAEQLGVSRPTMRRAISYLVERGLLVRRRGIGTQVVLPKVRRPVELSSLYDDLVRSGRVPRTEVLDLQVEPISDVAAHALSLPEGTPATHVTRLRYSDDEPLALMRNVLPTTVVHLDEGQLTAHGLYELLRAAGSEPRMATEVIGARSATAHEARMLLESRGAPLLTMTRTAWGEAGTAVEYGSHLYRATRHSFTVSLTVG